MDYKFSRLGDSEWLPRGIDWGKLQCRINIYHVKTVVVLLFISSFSFIIVQNYVFQGNRFDFYLLYVSNLLYGLLAPFPGNVYTTPFIVLLVLQLICPTTCNYLSCSGFHQRSIGALYGLCRAPGQNLIYS